LFFSHYLNICLLFKPFYILNTKYSLFPLFPLFPLLEKVEQNGNEGLAPHPLLEKVEQNYIEYLALGLAPPFLTSYERRK